MRVGRWPVWQPAHCAVDTMAQGRRVRDGMTALRSSAAARLGLSRWLLLLATGSRRPAARQASSDVEVEVRRVALDPRLALAGGAAARTRHTTSRCRSGSAPPRRRRSPCSWKASSPPRPLTHDLMKTILERVGRRACSRWSSASCATTRTTPASCSPLGRRGGGDRQPPERRDRAGGALRPADLRRPRAARRRQATIDLRGAGADAVA